jgi:hypothetical protein
MIRDKELASRLLALLKQISDDLNESIREVQEQCTDEEFKAYRRGAGMVMGYAYTDVMVPIFLDHPDLVPPGLNLQTTPKPKL